MRFKTNTSVEIIEDQLMLDFTTAAKYEKLKVGGTCLYILHTLYTEYIPYSAITRAYRRIEDVRGKLCCGVCTYEVHHLVIEADGREITILLEGKEAAQTALEEIGRKNPAAVVGYHK